MPKSSLDNLNNAETAMFVQSLGDVFEHSPWVTQQAAARRPFATVEALHAAMFEQVAALSFEAKRDFLCGHPELGAMAGGSDMTVDSRAEQTSIGLARMAAADSTRLEELNATYRGRFGFPFILCVRRPRRASILAEFERRIAADVETELETALQEIFYITRLRVVARVDGPGIPHVHGHLSTQVLDTLAGRPADGVRVELRDLSGDRPGTLLKAETT